MSQHPNASNPIAPPTPGPGELPAGPPVYGGWQSPSAQPQQPAQQAAQPSAPPVQAGPPPYLSGPTAFNGTPPLGGSTPSGPSQTSFSGPPTHVASGSFTPTDPAQPARPRRASTRPWITGLAVGALIGAVTASLVAGAIYVSSVRSGAADVTVGAPARAPEVISGKTLDIGALLDKARPSVVSIKIDGGISGEAAGSGIVVDDHGTVLTNAHVVSGAAGSSTAISIAFSDGDVQPATLIGSFPAQDVALVRTTTPKPTTPAELGSSSSLQVGDDVIAIGNALNLGAQPSVTKGIVSALDRQLDAEGEHLEDLIQTDAAINPGNSGGPLVNARGQVVGVNTAIIQNSQSVGFALSIDSVKPLIADIENGKGTIDGDSPFLGVSTLDVASQSAEIRQRYGIDVDRGAFVSSVQPGSAAAKAGLQPGDVVLEVDGQVITTNDDVGKAISDRSPGDTVRMEIKRQGDDQTITATLGRRGG